MAIKRIGKIKLTDRELTDNKELILWLAKHGMSYRNIKYLKWCDVDQERRIVRIKYNLTQERFVKVPFHYPAKFDSIFSRERWSKIFVFVLSCQSRHGDGFPRPSAMYTEADIESMVIRSKETKEFVQKPLTQAELFGSIELAKANLVS